MSNPSKRKFLVIGSVGVGAALFGCSWPVAANLEPIVVSREQLQRSLQERLAQHWRLANWLELRIEDMQVDLLAQTQQIQVSLGVTLQESLLKSRWPVQAKVGFSPRFDNSKSQFVLHQVQLLSLESPSLPTAIMVTTRALVAQALSSQLEGQPLYALKPSDQQTLQRYGVQPGLVVIEPDQVRIPLVPRPSV